MCSTVKRCAIELVLMLYVLTSSGCAVAWFLLSAKYTKNLTEKEVNILWKSHKQFNHCNAEMFTEITKGKKIIGYICGCGHKHKQQRPMVNFGR